ncbi:MAG: SpoIID/LytB domain-containing protein [Thermoanaerobaculia bacterium]|nr:SpoIID/LytB domain-containing protein [Thermoanaerobaculia bacterium]
MTAAVAALPLLLLAVLLACSGARPAPPAAAAPPPERPAARPAQTAPAAPQPAPPALPPTRPAHPVPTIPEVVRVGLATDLDEVTLPCCDRELVAATGGRTVAVVAPLRVRPAVSEVAVGSFRLQVAALKAEAQARSLAAAVTELSGLATDVVFDAGSDLYRVRAGRFAERAEAEAARRRLAERGVHDAWVVSEQPELESPAMEVALGQQRRVVEGRWLEVSPRGGEGISVRGQRYRGRILVYLNDRGSLNLINEVTLEDYLRGVVPREMGPAIYDDLEALKAQAVAARTYTVRNLGEFQGEGYDLCATPRCQVYGGMGAEQELTDRAVLETVGEVLVYRGELVNAMYSSTCGGHTENVEVMFPLKTDPYLRGVPCLEAGVETRAGDARPGVRPTTELARRLLPPSEGSETARAERRFQALAELAGLPIPADRLASLERRELQRFVGSIFDLALDARLFVAPEDLDYLLARPPDGWSEADRRLAVYLRQAGLLEGRPEAALDREGLDAVLYRLAVYLQVIEERRVRFQALEPGALRTREGDEVARFELPGSLATFRRRAEESAAATLRLIPGDRLTLFFRRGELLGIEQEVDEDGVGYDRTSNRSRWTRFRSDDRLQELVGALYPGFDLAGIEVVERGVSGRVAKLALLGGDGRREELAGLPIRWTLELPDNLFTVRRLTPADGPHGWLFTGRGWGHGVGMCQVGAYGMALRGHGYEQILRHYYSGVALVRARVEAPPPAAAAPGGLW